MNWQHFANFRGHGILFVMKTINCRWNKLIGDFLTLIAFILLGVVIAQCFGKDIWYDEVFSVGMSSHSYRDIIQITANDVHPPLYYFYLKTLHDICAVFFPKVSEIIIFKLSSVLPAVGIFVIGFTSIRKEFGRRNMGLFLFLFMAMPQLANYMVEIRMYSLASFFITLAFIMTIRIANEKGKQYINFIVLFLCGIFTAYTQYYACIAIIALYINLLIWILLKMDKRVYLKYWIVSVLCSIICYLPWLFVLKKQLEKVTENYWILPLTFRSLFGCIKYIFLPVSIDIKADYILAVLMILVTVIAFILFIVKKPSKDQLFFVFSGFFMIALVIAAGFIFSILNRPIFIYRYMIPCLPVIWLIIAFLLNRMIDKKWTLLLLLPFIIAGFFSMKGFYQEEHKKFEQMKTTEEALDQIPRDAVIITNFDHVQAISAFYLPNDLYLYGGGLDPLVSSMFENSGHVCDDAKVVNLVAQNKKIYYLGSFNTREDIIAAWDKLGITAKEEGSYLLERYWFNIYQLYEKE